MAVKPQTGSPSRQGRRQAASVAAFSKHDGKVDTRDGFAPGPDLNAFKPLQFLAFTEDYLGRSPPPPAQPQIQPNIAKSKNLHGDDFERRGCVKLSTSDTIALVASKRVAVWTTTRSLISTDEKAVHGFRSPDSLAGKPFSLGPNSDAYHRRDAGYPKNPSPIRTAKRLSNYNSVIPPPPPLNTDPDMHPLKRRFEPVLLDRYPSRDATVDELSRRGKSSHFKSARNVSLSENRPPALASRSPDHGNHNRNRHISFSYYPNTLQLKE